MVEHSLVLAVLRIDCIRPRPRRKNEHEETQILQQAALVLDDGDCDGCNEQRLGGYLAAEYRNEPNACGGRERGIPVRDPY